MTQNDGYKPHKSTAQLQIWLLYAMVRVVPPYRELLIKSSQDIITRRFEMKEIDSIGNRNPRRRSTFNQQILENKKARHLSKPNVKILKTQYLANIQQQIKKGGREIHTGSATRSKTVSSQSEMRESATILI